MIEALANHLWQSTLFAVGAGLFTLTFRKNQARVRYWLWLIASVKFLVPFSLLIWVGSHWEWGSLPARSDWSFALAGISEPLSAPMTLLAARGPVLRPSGVIPWVLCLTWLSGLASVAFWRWRDWMRIRAAVHAATPSGLVIDIPVISSPLLFEPGVFGIFHPALLLPEGIDNQLSREELQAIITHELCHVRRRDNLAAMLHMIVEAIFWFHPLVWWLGTRLVKERERACDEEVLRTGSQPQVYAESILKACRFYLESPVACVSRVTGANLKERMERIMSYRAASKLNFGRKLLLASAALAALTGPVAVGLFHAPITHAQTQPAAATGSVTFEAASVKPNKAGDKPRFEISHGRVTFRAAAFADCMERAFGIKRYQLMGPDWMRTERYDIVATAGNDASTDKLMSMLQRLLTERFKLAIHRETKDLPVYALTVSKSGPKFHASESEGPSSIRPEGGALVFRKYSMPDLAGFLSRIGEVERPIIDKTGLQGTFDLTLRLFDNPNMTPLEMKRAMEQGRSDSSIYSDLPEQIGLKLVGEKSPIETIVVDHAEKVPTEN